MGLVVNRLIKSMTFPEMLKQLDIEPSEPEDVTRVLRGGPVDQARGFVLHSADYESESTVIVDKDISLTPTTDILRALSQGIGPKTAIMALGYSGWAPGQLETEIAQNGWLTCKADLSIVFGNDLDRKYDRALALLGIHPAFLNSEAGHA